jgi:hypothetical protein
VRVSITSLIRFFFYQHLDIYTFLEILKKIQKIAIKVTAKNTMKKKRTTNNKIAFIAENINKFKNNQISRIDFVKIMALTTSIN